MINISEKVLDICRDKNLKPIKILYGDHVILCKDQKSKFLVLKTDNIGSEVEIYKILSKYLQTGNYRFLSIPKFYDYSENYIIMEYLGGIKPNEDIEKKHMNTLFLPYFSLIVDAFWKLNRLLRDAQKDLKNLIILEPGMVKRKNKFPTLKDWFNIKIKGWCDKARKEYKTEILSLETQKELIFNVQQWEKQHPNLKKIWPTYGVYGQHHMIIKNDKIYLFDFGGHLKWRPSLYDAVWPLWWQLLHFEKEFLLEINYKKVYSYIKKYQKEFYKRAPLDYKKSIPYKNYEGLFTVILLERLVGCRIDILKRKENHLRSRSDEYIKLLKDAVNNLLKHYSEKIQKVS